MATEKNILSRIINKHDTEANWNKATSFIPKQGEIIIYDIDTTHTYERMKIGDGKTAVTALPFYEEEFHNSVSSSIETIIAKLPGDAITDAKIDEICEMTLPTYLETIAAEGVSF